LGLPAVRREMPCAVENPLLLIDDLVDETVDRGEPVRRGEPFEASSAVGRRGITEPAHAFVVVSERRDVLQCVGDVVDLAVRPCVVPVEDAHRSGTAPHQIPRSEVTVADQFAIVRRSDMSRPDRAAVRLKALHRVVILAQ
jgi:hypothetical protein